ncbi:glycosyl hydrolase [Formosa sp. S-31]|uniref:glycosyl hydrolase n=1 Tax=Formosa sp. S-31 TaxID=2790949 RepID=UPI003EB72F85
MNQVFKIVSVVLLSFLTSSCITDNSGKLDEFYLGFKSPPNSAKPRVWWHWMNGNITKDGIKKDLDWLDGIGIGGFQNFDANFLTPVIVPNRLVYMTPDWKDAFKFTTDLAVNKGMEMAIAGSPGWSVTGGPWVEPEDAMKKYVWTEIRVKGGKSFQGKLPEPPNNIGGFQDTPLNENGMVGHFLGEKPKFYSDAFVIAYKLPEKESQLEDLNPILSKNGGDFDTKLLMDHDLSKSYYLPPAEVGEDMWIQYAFNQPQTFKAFSVSGASHDKMAEFTGGVDNRSLKVSDDGIHFRTVAKVTTSLVPFNTVAIPTTTAKYWRMCFETMPPQPDIFALMSGGQLGELKPKGVEIAEFMLYNTTRIDQVEDKAGFSAWTEKEMPVDYNLDKMDALQQDNIIDITNKLESDGTINWEVPVGNWKILRFGYALTGRQNHPAPEEATGLEVDKLDKDAVRRYINTYLDMYKEASGNRLGSEGLEYMILDSYEAGLMNWTSKFPEEFQKRRGYSLVKWLPVLIGRSVKSVTESEKFLWDFRKTIGELIAENHYDVIGEELHKRGMKRYTESHENKRVYLADGMDVKRFSDIPMSAMWTPGSLAPGPDEEPRSMADIRESASVAHIYGKPYVAAESMTSVGKPFQEYPETLKRTADMELASGLNRFVIHTSVHQPLDSLKPGFSLGPFGQYFTRNETWSGAIAKEWVSYLTRSSYVMQQGRNVADILYYYGENENLTWLCREKLPEIPRGYEFDFCNATALLEAIEGKDGRLIAKSGNTYKVLMLDPNVKYMTLDVLKKLDKLSNAGVKIIGVKPIASPSLSDDNNVFNNLVTSIWKKPNVGYNLDFNVPMDVIVSGTDNDIKFRHRIDADRDIYWLNNRNVMPTKGTFSFRVKGKVPKLLNAETGEIKHLSYEFKDERTVIELDLKSWDAIFIIFDEETTKKKVELPINEKISEYKISGEWDIDFSGQKKTVNQLLSWTDSEDTKYYSGTAIYSTTFQFDSDSSTEKYVLLFDDLKNGAEVKLNDKLLGVIWKKPYQLDVSEAIKAGENKLEVKVTNNWVNRLIGDTQPEMLSKTTFTTMPFYNENSPLMPSGIIGEVKIVGYQNSILKNKK